MYLKRNEYNHYTIKIVFLTNQIYLRLPKSIYTILKKKVFKIRIFGEFKFK